MAVPAATNCFLFENVLEIKSLSAAKEVKQRGNIHFSVEKYETCSFTETTHTERTLKQVCMCVCVTDLFITGKYFFLKIGVACFCYT